MSDMDAVPAAAHSSTPPRRSRLRRFGAWYKGHAWAATALLLLLVLVAGFVALQVVTWSRVGDGVSVAGVSLAGLDEKGATAAIAAQVVPRLNVVRLDLGGRPADDVPLTLTLRQLGMRIDAAATAAAALAAGRHELPCGLRVWIPGGDRIVAPVVRVDTTAYQDGLEAVRARLDVPPSDARLKLSGGRVAVVPARRGREVDGLALERAILGTLARGRPYAGRVATRDVEPEVDTLAAEARAAAAAQYLARPITLRYRARQVTLTPLQMAGMLSVNTRSDANQYPLTFHNPRAARELRRLFAFAETPPVDATVKVGKDGGVSITRSRSGMVLDLQQLMNELDDAAVGGGLRTIFVALTPAFPKLTTDEVERLGLSSLGSQFVTYFDPRNTARATNIALAAKLVDGTVIKPGRTFSLNAAMGPRTANRGFDYAPVITADNVLRQGVGGGICQYATTLFNAVFFAGLPITEREAHSLYISHYPVGRDATVAWGSIDFGFRNDTDRTIMVRSWVDGDALTVALVGRTGRKVAYRTSGFYNIQKPAHSKANPRVIHDDDLGPGVVRWEQGIDGRSVKVERTVRDAGGKLLFRDSFVSHYRPLDWLKRVGT